MSDMDANEQNDSYGDYSVDAEDQPQGDGDSSADDRGLTEPLDEGYSPPEKWSAAEGFGNTPYEEAIGETLDQRVAQEVPEPDPYEQAAIEDADPDLSLDGDPADARTGRLVAPDDTGMFGDKEQDVLVDDVGIDGAGASAEEAAVHEIEEIDEVDAP
jgi:hypothetical protein